VKGKSEKEVLIEPIICSVVEDRCRGCGWCKEACEFGAIEMIEKGKDLKVAQVDPAICRGCGTCSAVCPSGSILARHFTSEQIRAIVEALAK